MTRTPTTSPTPRDDGTPVDLEEKCPAPPPPPKPKPQVPRKPQLKRVSFTPNEPADPVVRVHPVVHEDEEVHVARPAVLVDATNSPPATGHTTSLLIRETMMRDTLTVTSPVQRESEDVIIPPPPSFDTRVSPPSVRPASPPRHVDHSHPLPITVVPQHIVLPEPDVPVPSVQSTNTTNSPDYEYPPLVNYNTMPFVPSVPVPIDKPYRNSVTTQTPPSQVFRLSGVSSSGSSDYYSELAASPGREPDPPELLHVQYKTLPTVAHLPNSPCHLHPDLTYTGHPQSPGSSRVFPYSEHHNTPNTVPTDPYPTLSTVAGTYNPYTDPRHYSHKATSPLFPSSPMMKDINQNVARASTPGTPGTPKSVHSERRVHFGDVSTAGGAAVPRRSCDIKTFAIGEVITRRRHTHIPHASYDIVFVDFYQYGV